MPVACVFIMFTFSCFSSKEGIQRLSKLLEISCFASNEKQIDNHTLILDMLPSHMSVVRTYHCRGVFKNIFLVWLLFFVDLCSQNSY